MVGRGKSGIWGLGAFPSTINPNVNQAGTAQIYEQPGQFGLVANPSAQVAVGDIRDTYPAVVGYCNQFLGQPVVDASGNYGDPPGKLNFNTCLRFYGAGKSGNWVPDTSVTYQLKPVLPGPNQHFFTSAQRQLLTLYNQQALGQSQEIAAAAVASTLPIMTGCTAQNAMSTSPETWLPGTFRVAGVPFHVGEIKDARFDRSFKPTTEQRFWIERYVIDASLKSFQSKVMKALAVGGPSPSIQKLHDGIGLRTFVANMAWNPIQPTADEWSSYGGYAKWIARGGYPLMQDVLDGTYKASDEAMTWSICGGTAFLCADQRAFSGVSCPRAYVTKDGTLCAGGQCANGSSQSSTSGPADFWLYVKIDPNQGDDYHLSLIYDKPSKLARIADGLQWFFDKLGKALCIAAPVVQQQAQQAMVAHCIDAKTKKACVQGAKDCVCSTPQPSTALAVNLSSYYMGQWCAGWNKQENPVPDPLPSPIPQPTTNYWPWLIGGALVVGGILYARNK